MKSLASRNIVSRMNVVPGLAVFINEMASAADAYVILRVCGIVDINSADVYGAIYHLAYEGIEFFAHIFSCFWFLLTKKLLRLLGGKLE
jgi:hypothetical protein